MRERERESEKRGKKERERQRQRCLRIEEIREKNGGQWWSVFGEFYQVK